MKKSTILKSRNIVLVLCLLGLASALFLRAEFGKPLQKNKVSSPPSQEESTKTTDIPQPPKPEEEKPELKLTPQAEIHQTEEQSPANKSTSQKDISVTNKKSGICNGSDDFDCYEKYFRELVKSNGVATAFSELKKAYPNNSYIQSQCHPLTHIIGREATNLYKTVSEAYTHGDSYCWSGYYHGVMEGVVAKYGEAEFPRKLNEICADIPGKSSYSFDYFNCVHGLGHGIMVFNNTELFDSLTMCDNLEGWWEKSSCYGGVYMENVIVDNKNHFTKYLDPQKPLYPCTAVLDKYKNDCYLMQSSYMLKVTNGDFKKVFELCDTVEQPFKQTCFQSLGRDASGRSLSNAQATKTTCMLGANFEQQSNCIVGAVKDFVSYFHSDTQAKDFCSILSKELQDTCLSTTESYYKSF